MSGGKRVRRDDTPEEPRRERPARVFDEDAELYDLAWPGHPPELYDDLAELAGEGPRQPRTGSGVRDRPGHGAVGRTGLPDHAVEAGHAWPRSPVATWPVKRRRRW